MPKLGRFFMISQLSILCKHHSSRTSYHSKTNWVPNHRKLSHKSTGRFLTINQSWLQQSAWPSNWPVVQHSHPVWKIMTRQCCSLFLCCKKIKHENQIIITRKISDMNPTLLVIFARYFTSRVYLWRPGPTHKRPKPHIPTLYKIRNRNAHRKRKESF